MSRKKGEDYRSDDSDKKNSANEGRRYTHGDETCATEIEFRRAQVKMYENQVKSLHLLFPFVN